MYELTDATDAERFGDLDTAAGYGSKSGITRKGMFRGSESTEPRVHKPETYRRSHAP